MTLAYRWFCRLSLEDEVPNHSTFSNNRHGLFRDSDLFRCLFKVLRRCMDAGQVKGRHWWSVDWQRLPSPATRIDPRDSPVGQAKVIRGGAYLCHASNCNRYPMSARTYNTEHSSTGHMGFRCVVSVREWA